MKSSSGQLAFSRWLKFNLVGGIGILLQLALLAILTGLLRVPYMAATTIAVEVTVLHNFAWHERYTWHDRIAPGEARQSLASRLVRFHFGNGLVSIIGNLMLMKILAGELHVPVLASNMIAITICSLANFCLADRWVFARDVCSEIRKGNEPTQAKEA